MKASPVMTKSTHGLSLCCVRVCVSVACGKRECVCVCVCVCVCGMWQERGGACGRVCVCVCVCVCVWWTEPGRQSKTRTQGTIGKEGKGVCDKCVCDEC